MTEEYRPKYKWRDTWPGETDHEGKQLQDFQAYDGDVPVGRIRYEAHGPKKGFWQWSGHGPYHGLTKGRLTPHQGYEKSAREASAKAEDYYERLMAHNGLKASKAL